jgi:hypothetical protein
MARHYRALISVPIAANDDHAATTIGDAYAGSLVHPGGGNVVAGHLELVGEVRDDLLEVARVVWADPHFLRQLPPDWKP